MVDVGILLERCQKVEKVVLFLFQIVHSVISYPLHILKIDSYAFPLHISQYLPKRSPIFVINFPHSPWQLLVFLRLRSINRLRILQLLCIMSEIHYRHNLRKYVDQLSKTQYYIHLCRYYLLVWRVRVLGYSQVIPQPPLLSIFFLPKRSSIFFFSAVKLLLQ